MNIKRRKFLKAAAVAGLAGGIKLFATPYVLAGPLGKSKLRTAVIGVWNQGKASVQPAATEELAALVDVDDNNLAASMKMIGQISPESKLSQVKTFYDYRRMFDEMHKDIDAVFIAVPDHHHATAAMIAMSLGKAVYLEKPMAHCIDEVRRLTAAAGSTRWSRSWATRGTAARASAACASISGPGPSATSRRPTVGRRPARRLRRAAAHQAGSRRPSLGRVDRSGALPRLSRQAASRGLADMVGIWRCLGWRLGLPQPRRAVHWRSGSAPPTASKP